MITQRTSSATASLVRASGRTAHPRMVRRADVPARQARPRLSCVRALDTQTSRPCCHWITGSGDASGLSPAAHACAAVKRRTRAPQLSGRTAPHPGSRSGARVAILRRVPAPAKGAP